MGIKMSELNEKEIHRALNTTWEAIGHDILAESENNEVTKELVIEMVLDANRLEMYGYCDPVELNKFNALPFKQQIKVANEAFKYGIYGY